jgi:hypothetical protein
MRKAFCFSTVDTLAAGLPDWFGKDPFTQRRRDTEARREMPSLSASPRLCVVAVVDIRLFVDLVAT